MSTTFYGVLGVGPEADAATIREGYRQRVKDVHPDVNEDTDADVQFKRLTTARDVLLDDTERARYDRIGHASYVRHHVDCSAWETASSPVGRPRESRTSTDRAGPRTRRADATREEDPGRNCAGRTAGASDDRSANPGPSGRASWNRGARSTPGRTGQGAAETATAGRGSWPGASSTNGSSERVGTRATDGGYATSSFWHVESAATGTAPAPPRSVSLTGRFACGLRALGPWLFVHAAFLTAAVGTCLYVYVVVLSDAAVSAPLLLVLVGEVALAFALSSIHVISRLSL